MAFFGGAAGSGATIEVLSGASVGAASTTFGGSPGNAVAVADAVPTAGAGAAAGAVAAAGAAAATGAVTTAPTSAVGLTAAGAFAGTGAASGEEAFGDAFADAEAAAEGAVGAGAGLFASAGTAARLCGIAREDRRVELFGFSLGAVAATEAVDDGFATVAGGALVAGATGATGAIDGTAAVRTLVTIARAAVGVCSGSPERSINESTTPAPAVAPIAVATRTTRAVRAKLGAGAK